MSPAERGRVVRGRMPLFGKERQTFQAVNDVAGT